MKNEKKKFILNNKNFISLRLKGLSIILVIKTLKKCLY